MSDIAQPDPPLPRFDRDHYHRIHSLTRGLPPPLDDTPEALLARNDAAIAQMADMLPTNANEVALAAQCVAARAQADDVMLALRGHPRDSATAIKLNSQYIAMVRASLGAHGHLKRAQAVRHKRETDDAALNADMWTQHINTNSMQRALAARAAPGVVEDGAPRLATDIAEPPAPAAEPALSAIEPGPAAPPPASAAAPAAAASPLPALAAAAPLASAVVAVLPSLPAAGLARQPGPDVRAPDAAPRQSSQSGASAADDPLRDLDAEVEYYIAVYPKRAREIRRYGGLPPNCSFGPPDDDLVRALVASTSPALRELDEMTHGAG